VVPVLHPPPPLFIPDGSLCNTHYTAPAEVEAAKPTPRTAFVLSDLAPTGISVYVVPIYSPPCLARVGVGTPNPEPSPSPPALLSGFGGAGLISLTILSALRRYIAFQ